MKIRAVYLKVVPTSWDAAARFWSELLGISSTGKSPRYTEFQIGEFKFALLLSDFEEPSPRCNCVPVFELPDEEISSWIARAEMLGATTVLDGLSDPQMRSIVMADPLGNEFELTICH